VKICNGKADFSNVKPGSLNREALVFAQVEKDLAAVDVFHDKAQEVCALERVFERGEERMVTARKHVVLSERVVQLILLQNHGFFQNLNGIHITGALLLGQHNLSECTLAQHFEHRKVLQSNFAWFRLSADKRHGTRAVSQIIHFVLSFQRCAQCFIRLDPIVTIGLCFCVE